MFKQFVSVQKLYSRWSLTLYTTDCLRTTVTQLRSVSSISDTVPNLVIEQKKPRTSKVTKRLKKKKENVSKEKKRPCPPVLECFDGQYSQELGGLWPMARAVLLAPETWQYGVMLNRFATPNDITDLLQSKGFSSLLPQTHFPASQETNPPSITLPDPDRGDAVSLSRLVSMVTADSDRTGPNSEPALQPGTLQPQSDSSSPSSSLPSSSSLPHALLRCYIHPAAVRLPSQIHWPGLLKQYYLLNAASLLPVLALQVGDGEKVLDLCSAPGGKALAIMQAANPALLCCNEWDPHRKAWLTQTLESFLPVSLSNRVLLCNQDGRLFGLNEAGSYDKVLVDAPCSNDRSWLYSPSSQKGEQQLTERAHLPALQAQLLGSALAAVRPGGAVVYSTCTLSRHENSGVVGAVLDSCPEAELEDLWEELAIPFSGHFTFVRQWSRPGTGAPQGLLVVPMPGQTWGPLFLCRFRRKH